MCEHGDTIGVYVKVPAALAAEGVDTMRVKQIDRCIAPLVRALQRHQVCMLSSCCGHGKSPGAITLADKRTLVILPPLKDGVDIGSEINLKALVRGKVKKNVFIPEKK